MNAFKISAEQMLPYLESTDYHPVRNEKELPVSVGLCIADNPKSFYCIPLSENVPDLTSKNDLKIVQEYLINNFSFENDLD
jgi:glucose-1-phosphate thymidylyltransferase/glucose-1-phosphate adenylyltransferase